MEITFVLTVCLKIWRNLLLKHINLCDFAEQGPGTNWCTAGMFGGLPVILHMHFQDPNHLFPTTFPGASRNFFSWGLKMSGYLFSLGVMMSKRSMTKVLVVKKVLWKFNEFRQWGLGRCLMYDGVSKLTHSSIIDTVWYSPCTLCSFALSSYSGHLRSSSENVLPSRTNSLLNFHHQQELPGDANDDKTSNVISELRALCLGFVILWIY